MSSSFRTGELHIPHDTCIPFFRRELEFWGIPEDAISVCCWPRFCFYFNFNRVFRFFTQRIKCGNQLTYDFCFKKGSTVYKPVYFRYKAYDEDHSMLEKVRKHFLTDLDHYRLYLASLPSDAYVERYRWKTWIVLEYPYSSIWAKVCCHYELFL